MPLEIERKFLVAGDAWRGLADAGRRLLQFYLAKSDSAMVRVRIEDGARAWLTIKGAAAGMTRAEYEYPLPLDHAEAMLPLRQGAALDKTRFLVPHAGRRWEVDVYAGDNAGLVIAEIELASEAESFEPPPWLGREVTGEARYYASRLAREPFRSWRGGAAA